VRASVRVCGTVFDFMQLWRLQLICLQSLPCPTAVINLEVLSALHKLQ